MIVETGAHRDSKKNGYHPETVNFIDYEYATPGPAAFDLANHFSEWGGFDCDYAALPTRSTRRHFIQEYISSYAKHSDMLDASETYYVDKLTKEVDLFRGMPGLYWGIWGLIQATISQIDFDYASYADTRLKEYRDWRATHDGTSNGSPDATLPLRERRWLED